MSGSHLTAVLKADALGRVERIVGEDGTVRVRRVACGGSIPGSAWVARRLLARERRALLAIDTRGGIAGVPRLLTHGRGILDRSWIDGVPLSQAAALPEDFFDRLDELVLALHACGVCHNDLHKEQNVLVGADGWPALLDFQLASVHAARSALFASRARDDLRHVEKHRRRYTLAQRGPPSGEISRGRGHGLRRSWPALVWRRAVKPAYLLLTRRILATRDGEERRASSGPWPRWGPPVGSRGAGRGGYRTSSR